MNMRSLKDSLLTSLRLKRCEASSGEHSTLADETAPRKPSEYILTIGLALCIIAGFQWMRSKTPEPIDPDMEPWSIVNAKEARFTPSDFLKALSQSVSEEFPGQSSDNINNDLLERASIAVEDEDRSLLAETIKRLGINALGEDSADAAGLYLDEALSIFEELDDELGIAQVEMLRGELNIMKRANARRAAYAYDAMQIARWKVAHGQFYDAVEELEFSIKENLELKRFGAAAAVYQTLYNGYTDNGQLLEAQNAGMEIVRLHASSGRPIKANAMLTELQSKGLDEQTHKALESQIVSLQTEYEQSIGQLGQARDYQQLYNHFIHSGDPVQAWQFRLKSQRLLGGVSKRAMHRSQTGVLALLYTSNDHIVNAERSLQRAQQLFSNNNESDLADTSKRLQAQSY